MAIICYPGVFDPSTVSRAPRKRKKNERGSPKKKLQRLTRSGGRGRGSNSTLAKDVVQVDCTGNPSSSANEAHESDNRSVSSEKPETLPAPQSENNGEDIVMATPEGSSSSGGESVQVCSESSSAIGALEIVASQETIEKMDIDGESVNAEPEPLEERTCVTELKEESLLESELVTSQSSEEFFLAASTSSSAVETEEKPDEVTKEQKSCIIVLDSLGVKRRAVAQQLKK